MVEACQVASENAGPRGSLFDGYVVHLECSTTAAVRVPSLTRAAKGAERRGGEGGAGEGAGGEGHGPGGEGGSEGSASGGEEGSGAMLAPDQTFDMVRSGARLILSYDGSVNAFTGTVENTTNSVLTRVRIEVHLSNGTELGPTTPADLAPGQTARVILPSTEASFTGWVAHAEVGGGEGGESGGEHGSGGESGSESGGEHGSGGERSGSG